MEATQDMADSGNREDGRRKGSLLALAQDDAAPKRQGASLLSLGTDEHPEPDAQDAATRHRMARIRREAEIAARSSEVERAAEMAADTHTRTDSVVQAADDPHKPAQSSLIGGWRERLVGPSQPAVAPAVVSTPAQPQAVQSFDEQDDPDDVRWKPLIDPMKVIGGIGRSKLLIASTTLLGALAGVAIALSMPKMYQAWTEMIVDPRNLKLTDRELTEGGLSSEATLAIVENQVRVLTSGTVLTKVVDKLSLDEDPEFNGTAGSGLDVRSFVRSLISPDDKATGAVDNRHALATTHLAEALTVERGGKTFVISVGAKTESAEKSALIANTMTEVFMQTYGELQSGSAGRATDELNARLDEMRKSVEAAERKVETFKAENELIDPQGRLITDDEIQRVNDQLTAARSRTLELNARAASTRSLGIDSVLSGTLPEAINSPAITELRAQYAALTQEADRAAVRLGPRHPERLAVEAQLSGARERIATELRRVAASIQVELKRAVQLEQELAARLAQLKVRQGEVADELVTLRELERDVTAKRAVYEQYLLRARETGEQKDINSANVSVISVASPPLESTGPSRAMISLAGMLAGFAVGVGLGGLRGALESLRDTANRRARARPTPRRAAPVEDNEAPRPDDRADAPSPRLDAEPAPLSEPQVAEPSPATAAAPASPSLPAEVAPQAADGGFPQSYPPYSQPGYGPPPPGYATPYAYPPASSGYHPWPPMPPQAPSAPEPASAMPQAEAPLPRNQIDEISESLREVRKELNQLRERRSRRYF